MLFVPADLPGGGGEGGPHTLLRPRRIQFRFHRDEAIPVQGAIALIGWLVHVGESDRIRLLALRFSLVLGETAAAF